MLLLPDKISAQPLLGERKQTKPRSFLYKLVPAGIVLLVLSLILLNGFTTAHPFREFPDNPVVSDPIPCHSHNDYTHRVPLFDALQAGCTSVEADVWARGDELLLSHTGWMFDPKKTLTSLYVDPILKMLDTKNKARPNASSTLGLFDSQPTQPLVLLIDFKTDPNETWPLVEEKLDPLRQAGYLSYHDGDKFHPRAITVVASGHADLGRPGFDKNRGDVFIDARLHKLGSVEYNRTNSYYASVSFRGSIGIVWFGWFTSQQLSKVRTQIHDAHEKNLLVRYWDLPSWPWIVKKRVWSILRQEGVDIINVDHPRRFSEYLSHNT